MPLFSRFAYDRERRRQSEVEDVLQNLESILNTKRGWGSPLADFGIRPLTEYTSGGDVSAVVMEEIRENIERYEPRLRIEEISAVESESNQFRLSFRVRCSMVVGAQVLKVSVDTVFNSVDVTPA